MSRMISAARYSVIFPLIFPGKSRFISRSKAGIQPYFPEGAVIVNISSSNRTPDNKLNLVSSNDWKLSQTEKAYSRGGLKVNGVQMQRCAEECRKIYIHNASVLRYNTKTDYL